MKTNFTFLILLLALNYSLSTRAVEPIEIAVVSHKSSILIAEPLFLTSVITNRSQHSIRIFRNTGPTYTPNGFGIVQLSSDGIKFSNWTDNMRPIEKVSPLQLEPGQTVTNEFIILYDINTGFAFTEPKRYFIRLGCAVDSGTIFSSPISLTVDRPEGRNAEVQKQLIVSKEYGKLLQAPWQAKMSPKDATKLQGLAEDKTSIYAGYLALALGRYNLEAVNELPTAAKYLNIVRDTSENYFLQEKAGLHLRDLSKRPQTKAR